MSLDFNTILEELTPNEKTEIISGDISNLENIIPILLKRVNSDNVIDLVNLLKKSVIPSICSDIDDDLDRLFLAIEKDPKLIFDKEVQKKIEDFITKRFERDKKVVIKKTSDISKFVILMEEFLNEAITNNGSSSKNVLNIKEKLQAIDVNNNEVDILTKLQSELINAASSIEDEMNKVSNNLYKGKSKVQELEEKVKELEEELTKTKNESMLDHLTGVLTRRAYAQEIKKIESLFLRNSTKYAVVFFDLDHFKNLNDSYGHDCGDVILSTFAKVLSKNTRDHDVVVRYGGEEFVSIVHFNLESELVQYLKRVKTIVTQNSFVYKDKKIKVTFSAGVALRSSYNSYENTLQKADMLLYEAKESGRNKIILESGMEI